MPSNAAQVYQTFVDRAREDMNFQRYPANRDDYRRFFLGHLQKTNPQMMQHLKFISDRSGDALYDADVDHIVPKSVWPLLMPTPLNMNVYESVLTNLMIRDRLSNRANDLLLINTVKSLHAQGKLPIEEKARYVELFVELKHYDVEGTPWNSIAFSQLSRRQTAGLKTEG